MGKEAISYEDLVNANEKIKHFCAPSMAEAVFTSNKSTTKRFKNTWINNVKKNLPLYHKHGSFREAFGGFGIRKAVIGVGAGPSFNKNKHVLKKIYELNLIHPTLNDQPFIIFATNKQLKPLLNMGIYPHFTFLVDAGDALMPQFKNIPDWAKSSIIVAGLHTSNKILKYWDKRGGKICFYAIKGGVDEEYLRENTKIDPDPLVVPQGGNVLNTMWMISLNTLGSDVFMMVGNDLAYKYSEDEAERAKSFYADGDYRLNILNKRNEAESKTVYPAFKLFESSIVKGKYGVDFELACISRQMWIYKTYIEVQATLWEKNSQFFLYNCSEYGTLGVLMRDFNVNNVNDKNNWYLIDELLPKRWLTTTLDNAAKQFLEARRCLVKGEMLTGARNAAHLPVGMDFARNTGRSHSAGSGIII